MSFQVCILWIRFYAPVVTRLASHYGWLDDNQIEWTSEFGITASKSVQFQMRLVWSTHQIVLLDLFPLRPDIPY